MKCMANINLKIQMIQTALPVSEAMSRGKLNGVPLDLKPLIKF